MKPVRSALSNDTKIKENGSNMDEIQLDYCCGDRQIFIFISNFMIKYHFYSFNL